MSTPNPRAPEDDAPAEEPTVTEPTQVDPSADPNVDPGPDPTPDPTPSPTARSTLRDRDVLAQTAWYVGLAAMAFADGFGIYQTLLRLFQRDSALLIGFTVGLTLTGVLGAHWIGHLVRSRREGRGGNPAWIVAMAGAWLLLGLVVAWLRMTQPVGSGVRATSSTGDLAPVQLGMLLMILYLMTGMIAMNIAYRYGNPLARELRVLTRRRDRARREATEHRYDQDRTQRLLDEVDEALRRQAERYDRNLPEAYGRFLATSARHRLAGHRGDPVDTDHIFRP